MNDKRIVFVGGVHGVGKGTICKELAKQFDFLHLSASEVLKWNEISDLKNKKVKDFITTQDRLLINLNLIIEPNKKYLLDGHFTLFNLDGQPKKIDESTFVGIKPKSIILCTCKPEKIYKRLKQRDNSIYKLSILEKMQKMEIEHAKYISEKLNMPLFTVVDGDASSTFDHLKKL